MLLLLVAIGLTWQQREQVRRGALATLRAQAIALASHAGQVIAASESVLDAVAERSALARDRSDLHRVFASSEASDWLRQRSQSVVPASLVSVFDDRADLVAVSRAYPVPRVNIAGREAFVVAETGRQGVFVTAPVANRLDGRCTFFVARALRSAQGTFLGVAHVGLDCETFARFYERVAGEDQRTDERIAALFRTADGVVLSRSPRTSIAYEASTTRVADLPSERSLAVTVPVPGDLLSVRVSTSEQAALREWRGQARLAGALTLLATLLLTVCFQGLATVLERRERELEESTRLRAAAESSSRTKSKFLSIMSHEVRTPLNGILGSAEMLVATDLRDEQTVWLRAILASGRALERLLSDVLDMSRLEAGELRLHPQRVQPATLMDGVRGRHEPAARDAGLLFSVQVDPAAGFPVMADEGRLAQVLDNLVAQLIRSARGGWVRVELLPGASSGEAERLLWRVQASNVALATLGAHDVFAPFRDWDGAPPHEGGSTGLALSLSAGLVRLMGGEIGVSHDEIGHVCIWFEAPFARAPDEPALPPATPAAPGDVPSAAPPRVLVVEDNPVNALVLRAQLERLGCDTAVAESGPQALEVLARDRFDLVLMDCMLPGLSGLETTAEWRLAEAAEHRERLPIVALTANATESNADACRAAGMDGFQTKPCGLETLERLLLQFIPRWRNVRRSTGAVEDR